MHFRRQTLLCVLSFLDGKYGEYFFNFSNSNMNSSKLYQSSIIEADDSYDLLINSS